MLLERQYRPVRYIIRTMIVRCILTLIVRYILTLIVLVSAKQLQPFVSTAVLQSVVKVGERHATKGAH